jgi:S-adenosylmethionine hydrolase
LTTRSRRLAVPGKIEGRIVAIAENGNLVTDLTAEQLRHVPTDPRVSIQCDEHVTQGLFAPGHTEPEMTFLALLGPRGVLELEIVGDSASLMLGIPVGEKVVVQWE